MGLGLEDFLNHGSDSGGKRKFMKNWKKDGSIVVWVSTRAQIAYPSWNHPFQFLDTVEDEDGKEKEILRFNRFVSPDAEIVHKSQYFRDKETDRLQVPPLLDPFLLLREWLRFECEEPLDAVVFEWENPKNGERTQWRRGNLAKLVEKSRDTWNHTLDTKLEYLMVVVDDDHPEEGPQIVRNPKLLGDKMKDAIRQEIESNGDDGNPLLKPYAFKWIYDAKTKNPMESYRAFRFNKSRLTDAVREAITATEFPDPSQDTRPRAGDKAKIRAAMEDAARIDIPWDRVFSDEWKDEAPTDFNYGANAGGEKKAEKADRPAEVRTKPEDEGAPRERRRKKKEEPAPKPEPKEETIPCDECGEPMKASATKCPKCGQEYEVEEGDEPPANAAAGGGSKPSGKAVAGDKCWSCGAKVEGDRCTGCGLDVTDDLPYA